MYPRLEDWSLVVSAGFFSTHPDDLRSACMEGAIFDDPSGRFKDGSRIYTTRLKHVSFALGKIRTANVEYQLGKMNPGFQAMLEHAHRRLSDYESRINRVRLVYPDQATKSPIWKPHRIAMEDRTMAVALVSFGDGTWKVIVHNGGYAVVRGGRLVTEIGEEAMSLLKALPNSPHDYPPFVDFVRNG